MDNAKENLDAEKLYEMAKEFVEEGTNYLKISKKFIPCMPRIIRDD
ncbi:hypothetical protein KAW65_09020 [candidate division WOR-3 bacterium]|nr:hypothetical protein [candidate division WOR-3 bacterium]